MGTDAFVVKSTVTHRSLCKDVFGTTQKQRSSCQSSYGGGVGRLSEKGTSVMRYLWENPQLGLEQEEKVLADYDHYS